MPNLQKAHEVHYHKALVDIISMIKHAAKAEEPLYTAGERVERAIEKVRHPPQSGWLDEWGRLKGGHPLVSASRRGAPWSWIQNFPPLPSASSCSRMYWRTCSNSNPTVDTA